MITEPDTMNPPRISLGFSTRGNDFYFKLIPWIVQVTHDYPQVNLLFAVNGHGADIAQEALFNKVSEDIPDYFFIVDTDVLPPPGAIEEAIKCGKDVVVAPVWMYNAFSNEIHLNIHYNWNERVYIPRESGCERIISSSFSFICMKKKVLEELKKVRGKLLTDPGTSIYSDLIFFKKLEQMGIEVLVNWDIQPTIHSRGVDLGNQTVLLIVGNVMKGNREVK